jgi:branched-chain amino acid transport system permease protein
MNNDMLSFIILYYGLTTVIGGLVVSWHFVQLRRDSLAGAFSGFGAALVGFGVPGIVALWTLAKPKQLSMEGVGELDEERRGRFKFDQSVAWGMGAFTLMWALLLVLALNEPPETFLIVVAAGLYEGMLVFLVAAGFSIIFGLMDVLNLAQGALFTVGAYATWAVFGELDAWRASIFGILGALLIALTIATFIGAVMGYFIEIFLIRPTYSRPFFQIVLTFGLAELIRRAIKAQYGEIGEDRIDLTLSGGDSTFLTGLFPGTSVQNYWLFMIAIGLLLMFGVQYLIQNTRIGIIIRAGVQDSEMVEALGINVRLVFTLVFALGSAVAAFGGGVATGFLAPTPTLGDAFLLQALAVVVVGGLGSYSGTAIAAIVLGISGEIISHFAFVELNAQALGSSAVLAILLIVLFVKPTGLFGQAH